MLFRSDLLDKLQRRNERIRAQDVGTGPEPDLALELPDAPGIPLDAGVSEADADGRGGGDHQLELRPGRDGSVAQEGADLLDGERAVFFDFELEVKDDLRPFVVTGFHREVPVDVPQDRSELAELVIGENVLSLGKERGPRGPGDVEDISLVYQQQIDSGGDPGVRADNAVLPDLGRSAEIGRASCRSRV